MKSISKAKEDNIVRKLVGRKIYKFDHRRSVKFIEKDYNDIHVPIWMKKLLGNLLYHNPHNLEYAAVVWSLEKKRYKKD